ncbi:MAG: transcriptional regulator [Planctomycetaceae bacterium]|nr:transcriptional regulator [Planctomycetaceae bacterium]
MSDFAKTTNTTGNEPQQAAELIELAALIDTLPDEFKQYFQPALERALENIDRRRRILSFIQEALSQLRLDMKYLMFDLEATRRERDEYRKKLEEST